MYPLPKITPLKPSPKPQKGFAIIPLLILLVVGIAGGTYLVQTHTNFLPKAANNDAQEALVNNIRKLADDPDLKEGRLLIILPGNERLFRTESDTRPAFSVIKLWIAAAAMAGDRSYNKSDIEAMLIQSNNDAANKIITALGNGDFDEGVNTVNQYITQSGNYPKTKLQRKLGINYSLGQPDNETSPADAVNFFVNLMSNKIADGSVIQEILKRRTSSSDFVPNSSFQGNLIAKSGILQTPYNGRNDAGVLTNTKGDRAYFAFFFPNGGDKAAEKIKELEQQINNVLQGTAAPAQAAPAAAGQPASGKPGIKSETCNATQLAKANCSSKDLCVVDYADRASCKYPNNPPDGTACNEAHTKFCSSCRLINGLPKCNTTTCTRDEIAACSTSTSECTTTTANIDSKFYTFCGPKTGTATAPRPAGAPTAQNPTAPRAVADPKTTQKAGSFDNKIAAVDCPNDKGWQDFCKTKATEHGITDPKQARCYMINGLPRCKYEKSFPACTSDDLGVCSQKGGCVLEKATVGSDPIQYSHCANDSSGLSNNPPPTTTGTTGCESFKDAEGILSIPCYKIGVFTPEDLKATEAQAKVALERYTQYKQILSDIEKAIGSEIDSAIKAKAEEKIREAEERAKACLAK